MVLYICSSLVVTRRSFAFKVPHKAHQSARFWSYTRSHEYLVLMTSLPTTFKLSNDNMASEHNFTSSPLLRLPPELREKIWASCLSNIQICIRPSKKQESDIRDYNYCWDEDRRLDIIPIPSRAGPDWTLTHRATYYCTSGVCQTWRHPPMRLSQLWRVCKLMCNETYHLPFAACNTINIHDFATFLLLYKIDRKTLAPVSYTHLTLPTKRIV